MTEDPFSETLEKSRKNFFERSMECLQRIDRTFQAALRHVGIKGFRLHAHRHTFAFHLAVLGLPRKTFRSFSGTKP